MNKSCVLWFFGLEMYLSFSRRSVKTHKFTNFFNFVNGEFLIPLVTAEFCLISNNCRTTATVVLRLQPLLVARVSSLSERLDHVFLMYLTFLFFLSICVWGGGWVAIRVPFSL